MTNRDRAYEVENGVLINAESGGPFITGGSADPTGLDLPTSTIYIRDTSEGIVFWKKFDTGVNDWEELNTGVFAAIPPPLVLVHNGNLSNGQLVGYSNLVNQPIVIGFRARLQRITYINSRSNSDATFQYYRGAVSAPNLFHTFTFTNQLSETSDVTTSPIFEIGDLLRIIYTDTGQNPNDMIMGLFLEAAPA